MSPRVFALLCLLPTVLLPTGVVEPQQPTKVSRLGYLSAADAANDSALSESIRLALRQLGYIEGRNISINTAMRKGSAIGPLSSRPSWCVSRLISS
jgi:hypothetical protein